MLQTIPYHDRCTRGNEGYSLIEVLIAMAVFLIGILAVFSMQMSSVTTNGGARRVTENYTWAVDKVEELLTRQYTDAELAAGEHSVAAGSFTQANDFIDNNVNGQVDEAGEVGHIDIMWTVQDDFPVSDVKSVRVTVTQNAPFGRNKIVNIDFVKADI